MSGVSEVDSAFGVTAGWAAGKNGKVCRGGLKVAAGRFFGQGASTTDMEVGAPASS